MNFLYQLSRPWAYWWIKGPGKGTFDWWLPIGLALASAATIDASRHQIVFYGAAGVISLLTAFVQNLPGFFIAALAAVATFERQELDEVMPDPAPSIAIRVRGRWSRVHLTRRRFLSAMFAFLTAQSIFITLAGVGIVSCTSWITQHEVVTEIRRPLAFCGTAVYCLLFWQMITVTCLGLYYLGDRIHQSDS